MNNYSSADVKLGELLENDNALFATTQTETSIVNAKKNNVSQSAAELLCRNTGEGSETTVNLSASAYDNDPTAPNTTNSSDDIVQQNK